MIKDMGHPNFSLLLDKWKDLETVCCDYIVVAPLENTFSHVPQSPLLLLELWPCS